MIQHRQFHAPGTAHLSPTVGGDIVDSDTATTEAAPWQMTIEAYADTIVPGEKRSPGDRTIAGAAAGPGAVVSGAVELLQQPGGGLDTAVEGMAWDLNDHARGYAETHGLSLDRGVPPFVALSFADRTE